MRRRPCRCRRLPAAGGPGSEAEDVVAEFAEQFSIDVSAITGEQRSRLWKALGNSTFGVVVQMYIADFVPRVRAGLEALGVGEQYLGWVAGRSRGITPPIRPTWCSTRFCQRWRGCVSSMR